MATAERVVLRQRLCRGQACGSVFFVCRPCDRGQRYCSDRCRGKARREQRRAANRRHQSSPEGRLDHRDRQRAYRVRLSGRGVTDHSSETRLDVFTVAPPTALVPVRCLDGVFCRICGRKGTLIDPFTG